MQEGRAREAGAGRGAVLYAAFLIFSFFGWVLEEVFFYATGRGICDRGFLVLPLCPVYGLGIMGTYLILGVPQRMRFFSYSLKESTSVLRTVWRYTLYLILGGLICTASELLIGVLLDYGFGVVMWDYSALPLHVGTYICLLFAFIWGFLVLLFMRYCFLPIMRFLYSVSRDILYAVLIPLSVLLTVDLFFNSAYSYVNRVHYALW